MLIHTTTTANPEIETKIIYTRSGEISIDNKDKPPPTILKISALSGIPFEVSFENLGEIVFLSASDHNIREDAYNPEFAADKIAVNTTKFITSAA